MFFRFCDYFLEAITQRCSVKKVLLKNSQHSQEIPVPEFLFNFIKKENLAQVFFCEFCEIITNNFFIEHPRCSAAFAVFQKNRIIRYLSLLEKLMVNQFKGLYQNIQSETCSNHTTQNPDNLNIVLSDTNPSKKPVKLENAITSNQIFQQKVWFNPNLGGLVLR